MSVNLSHILESAPMDTSSQLDRLLNDSADESPISHANGAFSLADELEEASPTSQKV